jgi:uroporphyrinogen decarboxylase
LGDQRDEVSSKDLFDLTLLGASMAKLKSRERVRRTLRHEETDRVPLSLGESLTTSMSVKAHDHLKTHLGIDGANKLMSKLFQVVFVDERILRHFEIDFRPLTGRAPKYSRQRDLGNHTFVDEWGSKVRMPPSGFYYDFIEFPLKDANVEDLDSYPWPDPYDEGLTEGIDKEGKDLYENSQYAIVGSPSLGKSIFEQSSYLRGLDTLLLDLLINKEFAHALFKKIMDIQKAKYGAFLDKVGKYLDIVTIGDDLGMQDGPLMSPKSYREMVKPYHKEYFSFIKEKTDAKLFLHSCGSVYDLIPDLIDAGVDILNPVQVSARNMDCSRLKREFGDRLSFWGAIDTQRVLPFGSEEEVKDQVRQRIKELGAEGGYIPCAVHNIQHDVPAQNIVAMYQAIKEYGTYPLSI